MKKDELTYQKLIDECQKLRREIEECRYSQTQNIETTANLNSLINNQDASIWSINNQYQYVIFNDFFQKAYKNTFNIEIKRGMSALEILSSELSAYWREKYDRVLNGENLKFEFSTKVDNVNSTFSVVLTPVYVNGVITGATALSQDITEDKKAEQLLSEKNANMLAIMDNTLESIWAINPSYEILFANSVFKNEFYHSFGVHLDKGVNILQSLPEVLRPIWKPRYDRALNNERFSFIDKIDVGTKVYYVEVSMNPMLEDDHVIGASFFANDITERMLAQKNLKENESRLKELNITKDKFFSIIAHDLKSPFNSIVGLSDLLVAESEKGNETIDISRIIQKSSHQAMTLITNLLEWSRSQSGKIKYNPEYFEVSKLLNEEILSIETLAVQKEISLSNSISENIIIYADRYMISSIFRNLLSNALKFTNANGQILISANQDQECIKFTVADNGVGIHHNDISKLFVIDVNHSTNGTQNEQGTGLGLILCKEFIEKHGGKIWVESEKNKGSKFSISLPIKK
ncbi:PAS domain-containing sensor histidine kinase [Carboxylicivirga sp. M1479]|uniref:sensor histidine kinase n=1 Tax=Carboxylicivirga sp. M1479 TaxID=2594476 RepID=UPI001178613D|nr:PAS domain-containing sensor histidine kinase [Carboxylicivirga sp. M1479]TRX66209.1 PAS domain-containing sensor histidine kinase [Carboxylicivirga sp. M1479]